MHDVGVVGDDVFLAMELVQGETLRDWLRRGRRPARQALELFLAAGRGLAAAHAAGLVHHDFKPENVLVGADGGPQADQYSFCVALVEALTGSRPTLGDAAALRKVPGHLRRTLGRGLRADPALRFASLQDLLRALEHARAAPRRQVAMAGVGALALCAIAALGYRWSVDECLRPRTGLRRIWDEDRRLALRRSVATLGASAPDALRDLERSLDARAAEWAEVKRQACDIPADRAGDARRILEMLCLEDRREELRALVDLLQQAKDEAFVRKAAQSIDQMPRPATCAAQAVLRRSFPSPTAAQQQAVGAVREQLAAARALAAGGDAREALAPATRALQRAQGSGYKPLEPEALLAVGTIEDQAGRFDDAVRDLTRAAYLAEAAGYDEIAARSWCSLVLVAGYRQGKAELGHHFAQMGRAAIERLGDAPEVDFCLRQSTALLAVREGRHRDAVEAMRIAAPEAERIFGATSRQHLGALGILGTALGELGLREEGLATRRRLLELSVAAFGPRHVEVATAHSKLAESLQDLGLLDEALEHAAIAAEQHGALSGKQHLKYAVARCMQGWILSDLGRHDDAIPHIEECIGIIGTQQGEDSILLAQPLVVYAEALSRKGDHARAVERARRAVDLLDRRLESPTPQTAFALLVLGEAELRLGDRKAALPALERAGSIYAKEAADANPAEVRRVTLALETARREAKTSSDR